DRFDADTAGHVVVSQLSATFLDVIKLQQSEVDRLSVCGTLAAQPLQRQTEQAASELARKELFGIVRSGKWQLLKFAFCGFKIQGKQSHLATPLQPPPRLVLIHDQAIHADPEVGPQARPAWLEAVKQVSFNQAGKELLGKVFGFLILLLPMQTDVFVDGLPAGRNQHVERALPFFALRTARTLNDRPSCGRKLLSRATDVSVVRHK